MAVPDDLAALAHAHGVATVYGNWRDEPQQVGADTVRAVLAAMDVPTGSPAAVRDALREAEERPWRRLVAPTVVARRGGTVDVTVPETAASRVAVTLPDGTTRALPLETAASGPARVVDGRRRERRRVRLTETLGLGVTTLTVQADDEVQAAHLLVVPDRCPVPEGLRSWGWQVQLYALRSAGSWGIGDLADLRTLVHASGAEHGADLVLLNPLHAALPVLPQEASPYYPASRRFVNPLFLRVEECDGYERLSAEDRHGPTRCARRPAGRTPIGSTVTPHSAPRTPPSGCSPGYPSHPDAPRRSRRTGPPKAAASWTSPPPALWPSATGGASRPGPRGCATRGPPRWSVPGLSSRTGWMRIRGCSGSATCSSAARRPRRPRRAWPSAWSPTSRSGWTPAGRTRGRCRPTSPRT